MKYIIIGKALAVFKVRREVEADSVEAAMEIAQDEKGQGEFWRREVTSFEFKVEGVFKKNDEGKFKSLFDSVFDKKMKDEGDEMIKKANEEYGMMEADEVTEKENGL